MFCVCHTCSLEDDLCGELNLTGKIATVDASERGALNVVGGILEVGVVGQIEKLRPELKLRTLGHREVFKRAEVDIAVSRTDEIVPSLVAECIGHGGKGGFVQPVRSRLLKARSSIRIAGLIAPLRTASDVRNIATRAAFECQPGMDTDDRPDV